MGTVTVRLELPEDWQALQLPEALHKRLQDLLDRQDEQGGLSSQERREAEALVQLVDMLSQLRSLTEAGFRSLDSHDSIRITSDEDLQLAIARPGHEAALMAAQRDSDSTC
jgi:hypothetical protein